MTAKQVSLRGGDLLCELRGDRVVIAGWVVEYLRGEIETEGRAVYSPSKKRPLSSKSSGERAPDAASERH